MVDFDVRDQIHENRPYTKLTTSQKLKVAHKIKTPEIKNLIQSFAHLSRSFRHFFNKKKN